MIGQFFTSGIEHHHHWFRFTAIVIRPDGRTYSEVLDIGEVEPDGRADCQNHQLLRSPTTHTGDVTNGSHPQYLTRFRGDIVKDKKARQCCLAFALLYNTS